MNPAACLLMLLAIRYIALAVILRMIPIIFIIHPADWAKAEDQADIIAIVHSHPNQSPEPSAMDRQFCERSQLPWHIVNPADGSWNYCEPSKLVKAVR
jgi:proteasome lid subunit RPN8/RPN11